MGTLPHVVEDCLGLLQVYSDGSIVRTDAIDFGIPVYEDSSVDWKDYLYDEAHNLYLRLYKPILPPNSPQKLPIVYYVHGGGFCVGSRMWPRIRNTCLRLSSSLQALVVSVDHRLAPEHRLPAAVDDVASSLEWVQKQAKSEHSDGWFSDGVDFGRVYIVGDSSGGNIAHHLAVRLGSGSVDVGPVRVRGFILVAPFFGGTTRTKSEEELEEAFLSLDILDRFWRLSLPLGATPDHPFANPFGPCSPSLEQVRFGPILVIVGGGELLKDRAMSYAARLKKLGKEIEFVEFEGKQHGFFMCEPFSETADKVVELIRFFMAENSS